MSGCGEGGDGGIDGGSSGGDEEFLCGWAYSAASLSGFGGMGVWCGLVGGFDKGDFDGCV